MVAKVRSTLLPFVSVVLILGTALAVIAYGRGYRLDLRRKSLKPTGLIVVESQPSGAQILVNGKLTSATPTTLNLAPTWYTVTVTKEGYQAWEKRVKIEGEIVSRAEALLLPTNPSLTAVTASGVANPVLSPDGGKLAYVVPPIAPQANSLQTTKPGVWVLDLVDKPLGLNRDARQLATAETIVNLSQSTLAWSPDSKQVLVCSLTYVACYLLEADRLNAAPRTVLDLPALLKQWENLKSQRQKERLATLPMEFVTVATSSARLLAFSPDETKILYEATASATLAQVIKPPLIGTNPTPETRSLTPGNVYIYDIKEDRNYQVGDASQLRSFAASKSTADTSLRSNEVTKLLKAYEFMQWLPTSKHLMIVSKDRIEIMDYDGGNRRTAYAGPFADSFAVPWTSGGKIVILTNLNPSASAVNNLYVVNLR